MDERPEVTLEELGRRLDIIGQQTDWMVENLQSLFVFVQQMNNNGGGIRGMLAALKQAPPDMTVKPVISEATDKVGG